MHFQIKNISCQRVRGVANPRTRCHESLALAKLGRETMFFKTTKSQIMKKEKVSGNIIPGTPIVNTISCLPGGKAEKIIFQIYQRNPNQTNVRVFMNWEEQEGVKVSEGKVTHDGQDFPITLKIGIKEGLFLRDQEGKGKKVSIKNQLPEFLIDIPTGITEQWLRKVADQIVACWIIHGKNWTNRVQQVCNWPYGHDPRRPVENFFSVIDGATENLTLPNLVKAGCIRMTHTGQWNRPYALVPAIAGMQIVLHEFKASGKDVCMFHDHMIGDNENIWGGYVSWKELGRDFISDKFSNIANQSSSPFAFHLHATKMRFPNCTLASTFLLERIGEIKLQKIFSAIAIAEPERFYRLIDEQGITHRLIEVRDGKLVYENGTSFLISQATENVFETFTQMRAIELNPSFTLPRTKRLVLDTHFYMVVRGDYSDGTVRELSGGEMYNYLTKGSDASMHQVRNERLFQLIRGIMGVDKCEFHIYPPVPAESGNQYKL